MAKTVTLRLNDKTYQTFLEAALAENRPLSNLIETAAFAKIREQQFVDDLEMAEILENQDLIKRHSFRHCCLTGLVFVYNLLYSHWSKCQ
jgi:hypothetical protein